MSRSADSLFHTPSTLSKQSLTGVKDKSLLHSARSRATFAFRRDTFLLLVEKLGRGWHVGSCRTSLGANIAQHIQPLLAQNRDSNAVVTCEEEINETSFVPADQINVEKKTRIAEGLATDCR